MFVLRLEAYALFPSAHEALSLEKILSQTHVRFSLVPTPRELSSHCGVALRFPLEEEDEIKKLIEQAGINVVSISYLPVPDYRLDRKDQGFSFEIPGKED
jgi:hypothetical protein